MADEARWAKVREIIREECERIEGRILAVLEKHGKTAVVKLVEGKWQGVTAAHEDAWRLAYGAIDLDAELFKAAAWILSNPGRAPKNYSSFLNNWFGKEQQRLSIRSIPTRNEPGPSKKLCSYCEQVADRHTSGVWHCGAHWQDAMEGKPRPHMLGIVAKPVAGS